MEESVDSQQRPRDEEEDAAGRQPVTCSEGVVVAAAAAAAAGDDVISRCEPPDVGERISDDEDDQSDVGNDVTGGDGGRAERLRRQLALVNLLLADVVNYLLADTSNAEDWQLFSGAHGELIRAMEADILYHRRKKTF